MKAPAAPEEWSLQREEGGGPFTTRVSWRTPDGAIATWTSRAARKRGTIGLRTEGGDAAREAPPDPSLARRLRAINAVSATAFAIGGSLFAAGAVIAQIGTASNSAVASVYLVGGVFFSTGGYASVLQVINGPRELAADGTLFAGRWRWWAFERERLEWLAAVVLFVGTLVFAINLVDSFIGGLSSVRDDRLVWSPDMVGCALFLLSGHLSIVEICHGKPCWRDRDLGWWIVAVNQLGSALFMISAVASFVRPSSGFELNASIADWGTLLGALCFAGAGLLQELERPGP